MSDDVLRGEVRGPIEISISVETPIQSGESGFGLNFGQNFSISVETPNQAGGFGFDFGQNFGK